MEQIMKSYLFLLGLAGFWLYSTLAVAQRPDPKQPENENLAVPASWTIRLDEPDTSAVIGADADSADIFFVNMVPGWHITTGPAGIFYHPESTASGKYKASTKIHLFDPNGRNEAFGIFLGGQNLDHPDQSYIYFLLRNSGEYLIKKRDGNNTSILADWTNASSMITFDDASKSSVVNTLSVEVWDTELHFFVNGKQVHSLPKDELNTDGIVGLRINHALNIHVEDLKVENIE